MSLGQPDQFPTDEMTLRGLIQASELNPNTGRTHLQDFLHMGTKVKSETLVEDGEGLSLADAPVYLVEFEDGAAPWSEQQVIQALATEILRLRGEL